MTDPAENPIIKEAHGRANMIWQKQEASFRKQAEDERKKSNGRNVSPTTKDECLQNEAEHLTLAEYCRQQIT